MTEFRVQTIDRPIRARRQYEIIDYVERPAFEGRKFHFIGAGGIGMSGLAKMLLDNKASVSGSDQTRTEVTEALADHGANIKIGHGARHIEPDVEAVVISAAIKENNPELKLARDRNLKVYKYSQMLGELMSYYEGIAIAGTHGKSTTSGWLVNLLKKAGVDPSFIIGAQLSEFGSSSGVGSDRFFVAEACEYDRSFLNLHPKFAAILNIEADHLDYYRDEFEIIQAFMRFAKNLRSGGVLIANGQDRNVKRILDSLRYDHRICFETFGFSENCNYHAKKIRLYKGIYHFDVYHNGVKLGRTKIYLPGRHNILNALAVTALARNIGVHTKVILEMLFEFKGIDRRLMLKDKISDITVIDDYGHHPTEIKASLKAIRQRYKSQRIWCVFQPHQYSRTRFLLEDFAQSFKLADVTIVPEIYFVRDTEISKTQVNAEILVEKIKEKGSEAIFIDSFKGICDFLKDRVKSGDLVVTMGAGDIWKVADEYIRWLRDNR